MRIDYELIVPSASRPHLLEPALGSLFAQVDQLPVRVIVHDDAAFPGRRAAVEAVLARVVPPGIPLVYQHDDPPWSHGPALHWLLAQAQTEFLLYTQDDLRVVRPLPIQQTLWLMRKYQLHHVRFNKRPTMEWKRDWQKLPVEFDGVTFCISDHWYFQTSLWRKDMIRPVVAWLWAMLGPRFADQAEAKINHVLDGREPHFGHPFFPLPPKKCDPMHPRIRHEFQRTYIWGPVGEDRFVENLGFQPEDWALTRARGGVGIRDSQGGP